MLPLSQQNHIKPKQYYKHIITHCWRRTILMVSSKQGTTRLTTMRMMTWIFARCLASFWHFARAFGSATFEFQLSLRASGKVELWTDGRPSENPIQLISESSNPAMGRSMPMSCYLLEGYESCKFPILFAGAGPPFLNQQCCSKSIS